jgi:DNA adenine methylase
MSGGQLELFAGGGGGRLEGVGPLRGQILKWIGNKQRMAAEIVCAFPPDFRCYFEPFSGSGAVLAELAPRRAVAADILAPLVGIHRRLVADPDGLVADYAVRREAFEAAAAADADARDAAYKTIRARYNAGPNADDLLFLARSCYGGVIRFSLRGEMNTPCGPHRPISGATLARRVAAWRPRVLGTEFVVSDFEAIVDSAGRGDLVYCDPPYSDSEGTLYGAQTFSLARLVAAIERAKARGAHVALSIDGTKRSGRKIIELGLPDGLFASTRLVRVGRSMLRRFQMEGQTLEHEVVHDRLLLTWPTA